MGAEAFCSHGQAAWNAATSEDVQAEAEVRALSAEEVQALLRRNAVAMARLWSHDFVVTNPLSRFVTKRQVLAIWIDQAGRWQQVARTPMSSPSAAARNGDPKPGNRYTANASLT